MHRERDTIRERGAELVFIGIGNRHFAEAFQKQFDIQAPLYVDTKRDAYRALGMRRGASDIFNRSSLRNMARPLRAMFLPGLIQGDGRQLAAEYSAEVAEEHEHHRPLRPQLVEPVLAAAEVPDHGCRCFVSHPRHEGTMVADPPSVPGEPTLVAPDHLRFGVGHFARLGLTDHLRTAQPFTMTLTDELHRIGGAIPNIESGGVRVCLETNAEIALRRSSVRSRSVPPNISTT